MLFGGAGGQDANKDASQKQNKSRKNTNDAEEELRNLLGGPGPQLSNLEDDAIMIEDDAIIVDDDAIVVEEEKKETHHKQGGAEKKTAKKAPTDDNKALQNAINTSK